jgi:hypothetical protein
VWGRPFKDLNPGGKFRATEQKENTRKRDERDVNDNNKEEGKKRHHFPAFSVPT